MKRSLHTITYANVVSTLALFVALGGASYAAVKLPAGSVGHAQVRASAITSAQVRDHTLQSRDFKAGALKAGTPGPQGPQGPAGERGPQGPAGDPAAALTPGSVTTSALAPSSVTYSKLGIVTVSNVTPDDATTAKSIQLNCPAGTTILSGSTGITHNLLPVHSVAALSYDGGLAFQNGWFAEAYATGAGSWSLNAVALCIKN